MVVGLPSRVYFYATNMIGKPADIGGKLVTGTGAVLAKFSSYHQGMGVFTIVPQANEKYFVKIIRPVGIKSVFALPAARSQGITMRLGNNNKDKLSLTVYSRRRQQQAFVCVIARENLLALQATTFAAGKNEITVPLEQILQGIARVTIFDGQLLPQAERLVYLGRGHDLRVSVKATRQSYHPRDAVRLDIETKTQSGEAIAANLCLSVVDDTVLSFADDKTAHILAQIYLSKELPGKIEEPNFYFSKKPKAETALDMLLATRGWRTFDWKNILCPPLPMPQSIKISKNAKMDRVFFEKMKERKAMPKKGAVPRLAAMKKAAPEGLERPQAKMPEPQRRLLPVGRRDKREEIALKERPTVAGKLRRQKIYSRKFPLPVYQSGYDGPRTDFRETIFWNPYVVTNAKGQASVKFYLSDAITTFRATAEGVAGNGQLGRAEALVQSKLPFYMTVKTPVQVAAGDTIYLPLSLINEQSTPLALQLQTRFSSLFKLLEDVAPDTVKLKGGERMSLFYPLAVVGKNGKGEIYFRAQALGLKDEFQRTIRVAPRGFPKKLSFSGTLVKEARHVLPVPSQVIPGSPRS